jgi:DNA-binding response OmpR family regulator
MAPSGEAKSKTTPKRVLIVDDDAAVAAVLAEHLSDAYAVEIVSNGSQALDAVRRARPDLVLLDLNMPGLSGLDVLRRLRAMDARLPVLIVTGTSDDALIGETIRSGGFSYIRKPFSTKYLLHMVAAALRST